MSEQPVVAERSDEIAYELRAAEASLWTGSRLAIGIAAFAFASLAFAYFYLRSLNSENLWRPHGTTAPTGTGAAVMAFTLAAAVMYVFASRRLRQGISVHWQVAGWTAVLSGLLAVGLQIWQLTDLHFFPGTSGYSSCFIGWASLNIAVLLGGTYWIETLLARSLRLSRALAQEGGSAGSPLPAARLLRANVEGAGYFWAFIALVAVLFWLLFYVI